MVRLPIPLLAIALMAGACGGSDSGGGPPAEDVAAGRVVEVSGAVSAERPGAGGAVERRSLKLHDEVAGMDTIVTAADASVTIRLDHNGARWTLDGGQKKQLSTSAAWRAPKQGSAEALAGERDDHTAAAGRHAEREAAETRATGGLRPMMPEKRAEPENAAAAPPGAPAPAPAPMPPPPARLDEGKMGKRETSRAPGQYEMKRKAEPPRKEPPAKPIRMSDPTDPLGGDWESPRSPAPPPPPDKQVSGSVDKTVLVAAVRDRSAGFERCWADSGRTGELKVQLRISLDAGGQVTSVSAGGADGTLATCLERAAKAITFAAPGAPVQFTYPLVFRTN
jgi:hypothetical protein